MSSTDTDTIEINVPVGEEDSTEDTTSEVLNTLEPESISDLVVVAPKIKKDYSLYIGLGVFLAIIIIAGVAWYSKKKNDRKQKIVR